MNAIYPACCRPFWENSRFHPFHHLSFEGWKSFDWRATSMRRNWPSQTSIWSHRRSPLGGLFFGTVFFSAEIFLPDGRESNGSVKEVGGFVSSQGHQFWWTHDRTRTVYILLSITLSIFIFIYIYTLYNKVALVVSDLLQDEEYIIIRHYCGLFSGKQRRGKGHAGSSTRGGMSSWMSLVMFLESRCVVAKKAHH